MLFTISAELCVSSDLSDLEELQTATAFENESTKQVQVIRKSLQATQKAQVVFSAAKCGR